MYQAQAGINYSGSRIKIVDENLEPKLDKNRIFLQRFIDDKERELLQ